MTPAVFEVTCHTPSVADAFVQLLPQIRGNLQFAFRRFPGEAREDALQESLANCFAAFARLFERGRQHRAAPGTLARFAVAQWFDGRRVGTPLSSRDVLAPPAQRRRGFQVLSLEDGEAFLQNVTLENRRTSIPDQAAFRVDFPRWLQQLTPRNRRVAGALAQGDTTSEVSARFGLSPARVSQLRRELQCSWQAFHGELNPSC